MHYSSAQLGGYCSTCRAGARVAHRDECQCILVVCNSMGTVAPAGSAFQEDSVHTCAHISIFTVELAEMRVTCAPRCMEITHSHLPRRALGWVMAHENLMPVFVQIFPI